MAGVRAGCPTGTASGPGAFLTSYLADRTGLGPATRIIMEQAAQHLTAVLARHTPIGPVSPAEADRFKAWLVGRGCARSTVPKWVRYAKHFFEVARRRKLIPENPFRHVSGGQVVGDPARRRFIPADEVRRVLEVIPNAQWRALVVLKSQDDSQPQGQSLQYVAASCRNVCRCSVGDGRLERPTSSV